MALSDDTKAWEKVVLRCGGGGLLLFCARIAECSELVEVNIFPCNHFVDKMVGKNWETSSSEYLFQGVVGEDVFLKNFHPGINEVC